MTATQIFNFSAGPAVLPREVLQQAAAEMLDWHGSGMSVMEMSHRGPEFISIYEQAVADLRELLDVPANYRILFMQGGGLGQNSLIPLNLAGRRPQPATIDFVRTGSWSSKSIKEAARYAKVNVAASGEASGFTTVPPQESWKLSDDAAYLHVCTNETIDGVEFNFVPTVQGDTPIVADMSSHILSRAIDVSKYGLIYGGAQKNIGPAGLTIVIVRDDLIGQAHPFTPSAFDYKQQADNDSMLNTPPTYAIYIAGLVLKHIKSLGGLAAMDAHNRAKAALLYEFLDESGFYRNTVAREDRSLMNVPFHLKDPALDKDFLKGAQAQGLVQLKGHRLVGGMRASLYNAMSVEGVQALVAYMKDFESRNA